MLRLGPPIQQIVPARWSSPSRSAGCAEPGARLWASAYLLNRDENNYPQPDEFRPERFLGVKPASHTWIPFGGGHTRCLGDRVALMELKATLTQILTTCDVERADAEPETAHSRTVVNIPATVPVWCSARARSRPGCDGLRPGRRPSGRRPR
ncbi:cytochrome P450 [Streptomyces sp. M19]